MATAVQQQQLTIPVFTSKEEMRAFSRQQKRAGKTLGFVPTMV
jgi:pantothenate synthetase